MTEEADLGSIFEHFVICPFSGLELFGCDCHPLAFFVFCFTAFEMIPCSYFTHMSIGVFELNYHINISRLPRCALSKALAKPE